VKTAKKEKVSSVVFDLDGTILNSSTVGLYRVRILCALHEVPFNERELLKHWGLPVAKLLQKGLHVSREVAEVLGRQWGLWDNTDPIPLVEGAYGTVEWGVIHGIKNFMLTSRHVSSAARVLAYYKLYDYFEDIVGIDGCQKQRVEARVFYEKPDPRALDPILGYLDIKYGMSPKEVVYVGDTVQDIECGLRAGVGTIGVLTGMEKAENFISCGLPKENIIPSIAHLHKWIGEHRNGHSG